MWTLPDGFEPLPLRWSSAGVVTAAAYMAAVVYYVYVRIAFTLSMGSTSWCVVSSQSKCAAARHPRPLLLPADIGAGHS